jgi:hypothetical protein
MLFRLSLVALVLALTACAAAVPGYQPPSFREKKKTTVLESGRLDADAHYQMSSTEKAMDCKRITGSMHITISRIKDSNFRSEPSALASGAQKTIGPIFGGSTVGANRQAEYGRERAKLEAYNRELEARNCKTVDIEAELAKAPEPIGKRY